MSLQAKIASYEREIKYLDKNRKLAWAKYYQEIERRHATAKLVIQAIDHVDRNNLPQHITIDFYEMAEAMKKEFECPICLTMPTKENFKITRCGHIYCQPCLTELKKQTPTKCCICRETI